MVDPVGRVLLLSWLVRRTGGAREQVRGPAEAEVRDEAQDAVDGRAQCRAARGGALRLAVARHVGHVRLALRQVVGLGVVHGVRALPRKVRHQQQRVQHVAHGVLQRLMTQRERSYTCQSRVS